MKTRAQDDLILAEKLVSSVKGKHASIYGGLCHSFPILVRTCGLCQAIAFSEDKKTSVGPRGDAHRVLLDHVGKLLGAEEPLECVRQADAVEYMHHTRRVLAAWIYFKRFAVSILNVEAGEQDADVTS